MGRSRFDARWSNESGAAVVEFALVLPVLLLILIGVLEYGIFFSDSVSVRQGVREAARSAVTQHNTASSCSSLGTGPAAAACQAKAQTFTAGGGTTYAHVFAPHGWVKGEALVVCAVVTDHPLSGVVSLPGGGMIHTETTMEIEVDTPTPTSTVAYTADADPTGAGWSWCAA